MTGPEEQAYIQGSRRLALSMLAHCLRELGYESSEAVLAKWILEREETVQALRGLCREFGDNDWPEALSLADVVDKHLGNYLRALERDGVTHGKGGGR